MHQKNALALVACLSFAATLIGSATARAQSQTYDILDFPSAETDLVNGMQDKVSGTINISAIGNYNTSDSSAVTLSFDVTLSNADGNSYSWNGSGALNTFLGSGSADFTTSAIVLNEGILLLNVSGATTYGLDYSVPADTYQGYASQSPIGYLVHFDQSPATALDPNPWTVAVAVPEPATMALGASALMTLAIAALARARRKR
jgi:hypothetical protein